MKDGEDTRALLRHIMRTKQNNGERFSFPATGIFRDSSEAAAGNDSIQMTETRIYIGLNDGKTREQEYETERYLETLKNVCRNYHVPFSVDVEDGGYYHEDGEYTEETSLILVLIDTGTDVVKRIAEDLCGLFNQESVLVTENRISGFFINHGV